MHFFSSNSAENLNALCTRASVFGLLLLLCIVYNIRTQPDTQHDVFTFLLFSSVVLYYNQFFPFSFFCFVRYALHFFIHLPGLHCLIKKMFETNTGWCRRFFHLLYCGDGGSSSTMASSVAKDNRQTGKPANNKIYYLCTAMKRRRRYS